VPLVRRSVFANLSTQFFAPLLATLSLAGCTGVVNPNSSSTSTTPTAASIMTQPSSQSVTAGQTATFTVLASGTAPLTYQWRKNSASISGATISSYTTAATTAADNGAKFDVVVSNPVGSATSNAATLSVNAAPAITAQPAHQTVTIGQTATFTVTATGAPAPTYQWQKNAGNISGATSSTYTTPATTSADSGESFRVVVTNSVGSVTSKPATLTVSSASAPTITTQPAHQTVTTGQTATFTVTATGAPAPTYQWQKNAGNISGATS
jgi:beta-galactosidase